VRGQAVKETAGVELLVSEAVGVGVVEYPEIVVANLGRQAELIVGRLVVCEGRKAAVAIGGVVKDLSDRWREAIVAVAVEADVEV